MFNKFNEGYDIVLRVDLLMVEVTQKGGFTNKKINCEILSFTLTNFKIFTNKRCNQRL